MCERASKKKKNTFACDTKRCERLVAVLGTSLLGWRSLGGRQERMSFERRNAVCVSVLVAAGAEALVTHLAIDDSDRVRPLASVTGNRLGVSPRRTRHDCGALDPASALRWGAGRLAEARDWLPLAHFFLKREVRNCGLC